MEITIKILDKDSSPKGRAPKAPLKERVDHAIDCIYCGVNKDRAIAFLQKVQVFLDGQDRQTKELQVLLERVTAALSPYGLAPLPNKDNK